uniref:Uncharacterized protein n=1 Tax=Firmicutes phage HS11 TaxID=3056393 RepID=A0AA49X2R9_9VIRU|nr:MAG: hypothetical protein [Firmicutes phage HS11]
MPILPIQSVLFYRQRNRDRHGRCVGLFLCLSFY